MSGKNKQGQGAAPPAPTTEIDSAITTPVVVPEAIVAPDTVTAETPVGVLPAEPFEPPLPIPAAEPSPLAEQQARLAADREALEADRAEIEARRDALVKAVDELEEARKALEGDREALEAKTSPKPRRESRLVEVKAVRGVIDPLRAQHREQGEIFRMREDDAERAEDRGDVEIL